MSRPASPGHGGFAGFSPDSNPAFSDALSQSLGSAAQLADTTATVSPQDWSAQAGFTPLVSLLWC